MKKYEKEVIQAQLDNEKAVLKKLEANYRDSLEEINSKIAELMGRADADMQHVIYQVEYQKALKVQVQSILQTLQTNEFTTVSEYLTKCYDEGFLGTMYALQEQGVPLAFPINQEQVAAAIQHETKLSDTLYKSFDKKELQKKIASEISRGFSTSATFAEISRNVASYAGIDKNKATRIVRTEGHRITETAAHHAQEKAVDRGADLVKIWDASLDARTRDSHVKVDGEIREVKKRFSNGLMYPGDSAGKASEVINCRCRSRTDARWALDAEQTKMLGDTKKMKPEQRKAIAEKLGIPEEDLDLYSGEIVPINAKNYADFKQQYNKLWRYEGSTLQKEAEARIAGYEKTSASKPETFVNAKTLNNYEENLEWAYDEMASNFEYYRGLPQKYHAPFDTFEAETPKYEKQLATAFEKFDFASNTDSAAIEKILKDGKLKGIAETNTSNGEFDIGLRKHATESLFGLYADIDNLDITDFEKYGYLGTADRAKMYGDCRIVFKKENLWDRTTFTVGDSLESVANGGYKTPTKVSDPKIVSFSKDPFTSDQPSVNEVALKSAQKIFDSIEKNGYFNGVINNQDYVELQFHGAVTLEDIAYIEIPQKSKNLTEILDIAEEKGVKIKVKKR